MRRAVKWKIFAVLTLLVFFAVILGNSKTLNAEGTENSEFFKTFYKSGLSMDDIVDSDEIIELKDGYVIINSIFDESETKMLNWTIRLDKDWKVLWEKEMGKEAYDSFIYKAFPIDDKSLVIVGGIEETRENHKNPSAWIVRVSLDDGEIEWQRTFRLGWEAFATEVIRTDRGIVAVGGVRVGNRFEPTDSGFITELSLAGETIWTNHIKKGHWFDNAIPYKDGFITGRANWIIRLDRRGEMIWERTLEGVEQYGATTLWPFIGESLLLSGSNDKPWLRKIGSDGTVEWVKAIDKEGLCEIVAIWTVEGGGFVVVGETCKEKKERIWAGLFDNFGELKEAKMFLDKGKCLDAYNDVEMSIPSGDDAFITVGSEAEVEGECRAGWVYKTRLGFERAGQVNKKER